MKNLFKELFSKRDFLRYLILIIAICFFVIPVLFNFLIMWDSGLAKGETADWFTFYGNIVGGLIGGAFTYLALIKTFKKEDEREASKKQENISNIIKECILNNKTYLNSLSNIFLLIQEKVMFDAVTNTIQEFIERDYFDFNEDPKIKKYVIDYPAYKECLVEIVKVTEQYEVQLKNDLILLTGNEFFYFQHNILTFNNHLKDMIKIQFYDNKTDFELLSNFIIWKENFGFRDIINKIESDNDGYYKNYINEDLLGDYLRKTKLPHVKG